MRKIQREIEARGLLWAQALVKARCYKATGLAWAYTDHSLVYAGCELPTSETFFYKVAYNTSHFSITMTVLHQSAEGTELSIIHYNTNFG